MPCTPWRRTSSATRNASTIDVERSSTSSRRSFGMTIVVSHAARSASTPVSAFARRWVPSNLNGSVTIPTVSAPSSRAIRATTGAAPEPVPPPSPAVTKTMSLPRSAVLIWSYDSSAARRPMSGSAPEPRPCVRSRPMWILVCASDICSCWMSVLTARNSTCERPASIIRCSALRPAPPTPTTRMTARYEALSPRGARWIRGAVSGSEYRAAGGSSGSGAGAGGSCSGSGPGSASRTGAGAATFSTDSSHVGTCSTVFSCGSSAGAGSFSPASSFFCAASVARKSSASGPSRIDVRFRATTEHLLRQVAVHLGRFAGRVVLQHRLALHGRLRIADGLANLRVEDELAEVLLQDLDRLARVQQAAVEHRCQDPDDLDVRVQVLADHRERVLELDEPAQREVLALHRDDDTVGGGERVDRQQPERRRRVDEDEVVAVAHRRQRLLERALATDHRRERELRAGEVDRRHGERHLALLDHLVDGDPVHEHVEHRALDLVRVQPLAHRQVALRVE